MHYMNIDKLAKQASVAASDPKQDAVREIPATSNRSEGDGKRKSGSMLSGGMPEEYIYGERNKHQKTFRSRW